MEAIHKIRSFFTSSQTESQKHITTLYNASKAKFIAFISKEFPDIDHTTIEDFYQESFLQLCEEVRDGKLIELRCNLGTYLMAIGKNMALKYLRNQRTRSETYVTDELYDMAATDESDASQKKLAIVRKLVSDMDERCKEILTLLYWHRKTMREIATIMNYQDEDSAKTQKYKCSKKLKVVLKKEFKKEGLI